MIHKNIYTIILIILLCFKGVLAQETFPVNGVQDERDQYYALINAHIIPAPGKSIENGILIIKKGIITAIGSGVQVPKNAVVIDLEGKFIYPSFIDPYTTYGIAEKKKGERSRGPQFISKKEGAYGWNEAIIPEYSAHENFKVDDKKAKEYRSQGFGAVLALRNDGIVKGLSVLVTLGSGNEHDEIINDQIAAHYSFSKGTSNQNYPSSLMGAIALLRQTYLDADWYSKSTLKREYNMSLKTFNENQELPQIFEVRDVLSVIRADKVGDEYGHQYIIKGSGKEYQRLDAMNASRASFILPINFPAAYDVEDPFDALEVSLSDMMHWEAAPGNLAMMKNKNIPFAITLAGLKKKSDLWKNIRKAIEQGLSEDAALEALTISPAKILKVNGKLGSLDVGKMANFIITSEGIFEKNNIIYQNWIQGKPYIINQFKIDRRGTYELTIDDKAPLKLKVSGTLKKQTWKLFINDSTETKIDYEEKNDLIQLVFKMKGSDEDESKQLFRLSGWESGDILTGKGKSNGLWISWILVKTEDYTPEDETKKEEPTQGVKYLPTPFNGYGWVDRPLPKTVLFKNATVWTNESQGIIENTDVLVINGKISRVGSGIQAPTGAIIVDGTGKHLTAGIIDEHSHIAISRGVNEGTQAVSAEVSIGDVINSENIHIYRQLAGGTTSAQLLHGSANPVGGQSAIIKMRWGYLPEEMKNKNADPFIKFALGENVKQSNWGSENRVRFPQTRMGVEQVFIDAFTRAVTYRKEWRYFKSLPYSKQSRIGPPRKDLELETLVQILESKRFVTCHSYVQSEINMLMKVAESFGFRINTFTHILEGYKVADKMKAHGVGASTFSDWWAYKYEVIDAIPYNGAILNNVGVITAFNSDNAELGRHLNQEAAKAVKYGNLSEEDAWKFVTLNPAKLLHIDDHVGSIKVGKDADIVIWSDNPLSIYAKVEMTYVDGICFYSMEKDKLLREVIAKERKRLIEKMIDSKKGGDKTKKAFSKKEHNYSCNDVYDDQINE